MTTAADFSESCHDMERHPAFVAWKRLHHGSQLPSSIHQLERERKKSAVYRLTGLGPHGRAIVAKRKSGDDAQADGELRLYATCFPELTLSTLELLGWTHSDDGYLWLFLEDAGDVWYDPEKSEHRALAIEWMAALHCQPLTTVSWLPESGQTYFKAVIEAARTGVCAGRTNRFLSDMDVRVLDNILASLNTVEAAWGSLEDACAGMPRALVHGDFVPKNIRVRALDGKLALVVFDWETAGLALPAADIAMLPGGEPERRKYLSIVRNVWPKVGWDAIDRMNRIGQVFRLLHAVQWAAVSLAYEWVERPMSDLKTYEARMRQRIRMDPWLYG